MALNLLLASRGHEGDVVILSHPEGWSVEALLAGLSSQLGPLQRIMFPLPDDTTRRYNPPAALVRSRHSDLWHALTADERRRAMLVVGPTAAYLTPLLEPAVTTLVALRDPPQRATPRGGGWRAVVGPFVELDDLPEEAPSEQDRERWLERMRVATSGLELVRVRDLADMTGEVAAALGVGPKAAIRAAREAAAVAGEGGNRARTDAQASHWVDTAIRSLSRPPKRAKPPKQSPTP